MKKTMIMLSLVALMLCGVQENANAQQQALSPTVPATPATPNGPGTPAVPATPASPAAVQRANDQATLEAAEEALEGLSNARGEGSIINPVVPTVDNSQESISYTTVLSPRPNQRAWVEAPSLNGGAAVSGWVFSVLQGTRRFQAINFPGTENDTFILIVYLADGSGTQQIEAKGGERYKFTPPASKFEVKRNDGANVEKLSVGLEYTGTGRTKLGMTPVYN